MSEQIWLAFNFGGNTYDVTNCTEKFKLKRGMLYTPDTLEATLYTPLVDKQGRSVVWGSNMTYANEVRIVIFGSPLFHGTIESWEVDGDRVHIKAIQAADRFLKSGYTGTITSANQATAIKAIATAMGMTVYNNIAPFTPATINSVSFHGMRLRDVFKRLCEFSDPANRKLQVMATFEPSSSGAELGDMGGEDATGVPISQTTRLISVPMWSDGRDRVVNHVIVKYRTGEVSAEDATSIATHTRRTTTLYRPEILSSADAQNVADTILFFLKNPAESCRAKIALDDTLVRSRMAGLTTFRVIDEISGKDKNMIIREMVYSFPDLTADVFFDTIGLSTEEYQATADARIATLEATQPDQELNSSNSPTFASANITGALITGQNSKFGLWQFSGSRDFIYNGKRAMVMREDWAPTTMVLNYGGDFGQVNIASPLVVSGDISAKNINLGSDTDTTAYYLRVKRLATSGDGTLVSQLDAVVDANRGYLTFSRGGSVKAQLLADRGGYWYSNVRMQINGALQSTALNVVGGTSTSDMGRFEHTGATASDNVSFGLRRTNQTGTQLYLDLWDQTNGKRGGINVGAVRINNTTMAIDANNDHFARYMNLTGTGNQFRCDNRIVVRNTNNTAYQDMDMKRLYISGSVAIGDGKNAVLGSISAAGRIDLSGGAPLFYWAETDQTLPAGRWRMGVDGDALLIDHNTASDGLYGTIQRSYFNNFGFYTYGIVQGQIGAYLANTTRTMSASSTVQMAHDALASTASTSYVKVKTITINYGLTGTFYVKFSLASSTSGVTVYGRLYKNGSALGSRRSTTDTNAVEFTEGPYTNISAGDKYEMYIGTSSGAAPVKVTNFRICFTPSSAIGLYGNS